MQKEKERTKGVGLRQAKRGAFAYHSRCKPKLTLLKFRIKSVDDFLRGGFMEESDDDLEDEDEGTVRTSFTVQEIS